MKIKLFFLESGALIIMLKNNDQWFDDAEKQDAVDVFGEHYILSVF